MCYRDSKVNRDKVYTTNANYDDIQYKVYAKCAVCLCVFNVVVVFNEVYTPNANYDDIQYKIYVQMCCVSV